MRRSLELIEDARERLQTARGLQYWRTLEELADTPEFRELVEREFPAQAVRVRVRKLTPPLQGLVGTPSVELTRSR